MRRDAGGRGRVYIHVHCTGVSSSHTSVPTTVSLLTASSDSPSPTDASALCAAAPSVPLQDKSIVNSSHPSCQPTPSSFSSSTSGGQVHEGSSFNHGN